jgi:hypothetical protein
MVYFGLMGNESTSLIVGNEMMIVRGINFQNFKAANAGFPCVY